MAKQNDDRTNVHPGSSTKDAKSVGGKGDFGVPENDVMERTYASQNTKRADPGAAPLRSGDNEDGTRTSGVGGNNSGVGSSSGGDIDTDIVGLPSGRKEG